MPVRDTSIEVFHRIHDEGILSRRRLEVYRALFEYGPATSNELFRKMKGSIRVSQANIQLNQLRERLDRVFKKHLNASLNSFFSKQYSQQKPAH